MALADEIMLKIKEEITNDPFNIGYAGKTDAEIATLLSSSVRVQRIVLDDSPSPLNRILVGIASSPNAIDDKDVTDIQTAVVI